MTDIPHNHLIRCEVMTPDMTSHCYIKFSVVPRVGDEISFVDEEDNLYGGYIVKRVVWLVDASESESIDQSQSVVLHVVER